MFFAVVFFFTAAVSLVAAQCPGISPPSVRSSVVQYNVSITFQSPALVGQFANGDFWVVGPVTIVSTSPPFDGTHHGFTVNPQSWSQQAYDNRVNGFNASLVPTLPATISGPASFVKAVSVVPFTSCRPCLKTAIVLTVVPSRPAGDGAGQFRPAYFGSPSLNPRTSRSTSELSFNQLPRIRNLSAVASTFTLEEAMQRHIKLQLDHLENWVADAMHPADNLPNYGASIAIDSNEVMLRLLFDDVNTSACAMIAFVQAGLDHFSVLSAGMIWPANGGHCLGRKQIMIFASMALQDTAMQNFLKAKAAAGAFHEDMSLTRSILGTVLWGADCQQSEDNYWSLLRTGAGCRTFRDPYKQIDGGPVPGGSYQFCCNSQPFKGPALFMFFSTLARSIWNNEDFYTYVSRWVLRGAFSQPDVCAPIPGICSNSSATCSTAKACPLPAETCVLDDDGSGGGGAEYRVSYGPDGNGSCILDTDGSDGYGRFPQLHGTEKNDGYYSSGFVDAIWDARWKSDSGTPQVKSSDQQQAISSATINDLAIVTAVVCLLVAANS